MTQKPIIHLVSSYAAMIWSKTLVVRIVNL